MPPGQQQQPGRGSLITGAPFFLPVTVPFTSVANEQFTVYTNPAITVGDLEVIGAVTDLESLQGQFTLNKRPMWSSENIPLATLFGKPDGPKPVIWFPRPFPLPGQARIRMDLINIGAEPAGTLVFICRQKNIPAPFEQRLTGLQDTGEMDIAVVDSQFTGTLNEIKRTQTPVVDYDFVVRALHTTLGQPTVRITGLGGQLWMEDGVPIWALAGRANSALPNQPLQPPCFIPRGYFISFEFTNVGTEASGKIFLVGQRLQ